jgi:hypothetical protein
MDIKTMSIAQLQELRLSISGELFSRCGTLDEKQLTHLGLLESIGSPIKNVFGIAAREPTNDSRQNLKLKSPHGLKRCWLQHLIKG